VRAIAKTSMLPFLRTEPKLYSRTLSCMRGSIEKSSRDERVHITRMAIRRADRYDEWPAYWCIMVWLSQIFYPIRSSCYFIPWTIYRHLRNNVVAGISILTGML
jgi:hypothetical protein